MRRQTYHGFSSEVFVCCEPKRLLAGVRATSSSLQQGGAFIAASFVKSVDEVRNKYVP